jgi:hypothetical protein
MSLSGAFMRGRGPIHCAFISDTTFSVCVLLKSTEDHRTPFECLHLTRTYCDDPSGLGIAGTDVP